MSEGNGFLRDLKAKSGENTQYFQMQWAVQIASQGIGSDTLQQAKAAAHVASLLLEDAAKTQ